MPITPRYALSQDDNNVILIIQVPHVRVNQESLQIVLTDEESVLHFASPPYWLLLNVAPHQFAVGADESCAIYKPESMEIEIKLKKAIPGEHWADLDLIGRLAPTKHRNQKNPTSAWLETILPSDTEEGMLEIQDDNGLPEGDSRPSSVVDTPLTPGYGFCRMFRGVFDDLARDGMAKEMLEGPCVWGSTPGVYENRRRERLSREQQVFSAERYVQDLHLEDDYIYQCSMSMVPHWQEGQVHTLANQLQGMTVADTAGKSGSFEGQYFTSEERLHLSSIPYPLLPSTSADPSNVMGGLVDLLFAYVYDHLTTQGESTVESAWTITMLSPCLSWLEDWMKESIETVTLSSLRRSLIYPYIRNLDFGYHVLQQVIMILEVGVRCTIRCFLQMRVIVAASDVFYLGNKLVIDPYLAWLQSDQQDRIKDAFHGTVQKLRALKKDRIHSDIGLDLDQATLLLEENEESDSDSQSSSEDDTSDTSEESCQSQTSEIAQPPVTSSTLLDLEDGPTSLSLLHLEPRGVVERDSPVLIQSLDSPGSPLTQTWKDDDNDGGLPGGRGDPFGS